MKKIVVFLVFISVIIEYSIAQKNEYRLENLYGAWGDTLTNSSGNGFIFQPDGTWMLIWDGNISGGNSEKGITYFVVNFDTTPISIDLIVENHKSKEKGSMLGIIEFIDEDLILIEFGESEQRPTKFSDPTNSNQQVLKRAKEN